MSENKFFTLKGDYAVASFILGILSILLFYLLFLIFPLLEAFFALLAIILGSLSLRGNRRGFAIAGIVMGGIVILFGLAQIAILLVSSQNFG